MWHRMESSTTISRSTEKCCRLATFSPLNPNEKPLFANCWELTLKAAESNFAQMLNDVIALRAELEAEHRAQLCTESIGLAAL